MPILLNDHNLRERLNRVANALENPEPLAADIERVLVSQSLQNFHNNGRPAWAGLSPVTLEIYRKQGIKPLGILQRTAGGLRDSVQGSHDATSATVGAGSGKSKDYAAIHQFGGMAGRKRKVRIPARSYLPIDENGILQPEAENAVGIVAGHYWQKIFNS